MNWKPSPSMAVALLALFLAIGGVGYAAKVAKQNSVVSKSIKNGTIVSDDVKDDGLTGADILESSLQGLTGSQGPQGPQGIQGPPGVAGNAGGDLTGTFDNLQIAPNAVSGGVGKEIAENTVGARELDEANLGTLVVAEDGGGGTTKTFSSGRVTLAAPNFGSSFAPNLIDTGNFSLDGVCLDQTAGMNEIGVQVGLDSPQGGAVYSSINREGGGTVTNSAGNLPPAGGLISGGNSAGTRFYSASFQAIAPNGATLDGTVFTTTNAQASDCIFSVIATERTG